MRYKEKNDPWKSVSYGICVRQGKKNDYITKLLRPIWESRS